MNDWIEKLEKALAAMTDACKDVESLISDYKKCESGIARQYLAAAVRKHASTITSHMTPDIFN